MTDALFFTGDALGGSTKFYVLPLDSADWLQMAMEAALTLLTAEGNWDESGTVSADVAAEQCSAMFGAQFVLPDPTGTIFLSGASSPAYGSSALFCDGSSYSTSVYPQLFAAIGYNFGGSGGSFQVPDLRGRAAVGAGGTIHGASINVGDTGGAESVTLDVSTIPAHAHTDAGHTHSEGIAVPSIVNGGLEAPAAVAEPAAGVTGAGFASIQNTGGGGAHENMPPWVALGYWIVTGQ